MTNTTTQATIRTSIKPIAFPSYYRIVDMVVFFRDEHYAIRILPKPGEDIPIMYVSTPVYLDTLARLGSEITRQEFKAEEAKVINRLRLDTDPEVFWIPPAEEPAEFDPYALLFSNDFVDFVDLRDMKKVYCEEEAPVYAIAV